MLKTKEKARLYGLASYSLLLLLLSLSATKHVTHMGSSSIVQLTNHHNYLPHQSHFLENHRTCFLAW